MLAARGQIHRVRSVHRPAVLRRAFGGSNTFANRLRSTVLLASPENSTSNTTNTKARKDVLKSKSQRQKDMAEGPAPEAVADDNRPKKARDAIQQGLEQFQAGDYKGAIEMFNLSLELPGSGAYRMAGSPREYSCPSEGEENAALYNLACAYAKLGQADSALTCIEAVLDNGFTEYDTIRNDADLAVVRGPALDQLLGKYTSPVSKFQKMFQKSDKMVSDTNKPWLLW